MINSRIDNVLVKIAPDLNQPLFQFITAGKHVPMVVHLMVNWVEVWGFVGNIYGLYTGFWCLSLYAAVRQLLERDVQVHCMLNFNKSL